MAKQQHFGGSWTDEKLERLRKYLHAYTKIFAKNIKAQYFTTVYVDAFAGTGYRSKASPTSQQPVILEELAAADNQEFLKGSARIALEVEPPFKRYIFVEKNPSYAAKLQKLKTEFSTKDIMIVEEDANVFLQNWCAETDWKRHRAVVFLDPYGMEVEWKTIESIARTKAIDLWLLFPLGVAVNRLLTRGRKPDPAYKQALDRMFGTEEWEQAFYSLQTKRTLFGEDQATVKDADFDTIEKFFIERLQSVFVAVAENPLPLLNSTNVPLYLLCFAAGNPKGAEIAVKIANYILTR